MTFYLSMHLPYACRHSGACCSSGWDIPIEAARIPAIARGRDDGRIDAPMHWLRPVDGAPAEMGGVLALAAGGRCVFHHDSSCAIHTALGHGAMPAACQHFPRVCLIDRRGVFVTLSHYCPTAAALLFGASSPVSIVEGPPPLPGHAVPEGLDARDALPPLRAPRLLMGLEEYDAWERAAVGLLTSGLSPEDALAELDGETTHRRRAAARPIPDAALMALARDAVPPPHSWPGAVAAIPDPRELLTPVIGRYLAAHAFASWMAYQGTGLGVQVLYLRVVLAVLRTETARRGSLLDGIRQADLLLRHLIDPQALASRLSALAAR